jgi:hypothetical protein
VFGLTAPFKPADAQPPAVEKRWIPSRANGKPNFIAGQKLAIQVIPSYSARKFPRHNPREKQGPTLCQYSEPVYAFNSHQSTRGDVARKF